ncbi:MAG: hypothetical protein AB8B87_15610 [Granulosicoccus sp.]
MNINLKSGLNIISATLLGSIGFLATEVADAQNLLPRIDSTMLRSPTIGTPVFDGVSLLRARLVKGLVSVNCQPENTDINILDEDGSNVVYVTVNETRYSFDSDAVRGFDLQLCGFSNSVTYQVGEIPVLTRHRSFNIVGRGEGFDTVRLNFANAVGTRALAIEEAPEVNLDLGALADSVVIEVRDFPIGRTTFFADMGEGSDSFIINPYGGSIEGSISIAVDAGEDSSHLFWNDGGPVDLDGDGVDDTLAAIVNRGDTIDINLSSNRIPYDIPEGSSVSIFAWGDSREGQGHFDNVADHGSDLVVVRWNGLLEGSLHSHVYGDDQQLRAFGSQDFGIVSGGPCWQAPNVAFRDGELDRVCSLKDAFYLVPAYASDSVQTRYTIDPNSTGSATLYTDGGVGDDQVVMQLLHKEPLDRMQSFKADLTGGQHYPFKNDTCAVDHPFITVTACELMDNSISAVD